MRRVYYYRIHDLLKVKLENIHANAFDRFYRLKYFQCRDFNDTPDINIAIGPFERKKKSKFLLDHRYFVGENYFYTEDYFNGAKWKVELNGLENDRISVKFDPRTKNYLKYPHFIVKDMLTFDYILQPILELWFLKKGIVSLHSASLCKDKSAILVAGSGGSFKTTFSMKLYYHGYKYMSDGFSLVKDNSVFSYPISPYTFGYRLKYKEDEKLNMGDILRLAFDTFFEKEIPGFNIQDKADLRQINLILKANKKNLRVETDSAADVFLALLLANNRIEMLSHPFRRYMQIYSYVFPINSVSCLYQTQERLLAKTIEQTNRKIVEVSSAWCESYLNELLYQ